MTVVSAKEFNIHQDEYLDMALDEEVFVKRGEYMYHLQCSNFDTVTKPQAVSEPDDDLRNAVSMDEFRKRAMQMVENVHHRFFNESSRIAEGN